MRAGHRRYKRPDYATDWAKYLRGILRNRAQCIAGWNFVLGKHRAILLRRPRDTRFKMHAITWAFARYSNVVPKGARAIGSEAELSDIDRVAFEIPDGSHALVVTNPGGGPKCSMPGGNAGAEPDSGLRISHDTSMVMSDPRRLALLVLRECSPVSSMYKIRGFALG